MSMTGILGVSSTLFGTGAAGVYLADITGILPKDFATWPPIAMMLFLCVLTMILKDRGDKRAAAALEAQAEAHVQSTKAQADAMTSMSRELSQAMRDGHESNLLALREVTSQMSARNELEARRDERGQHMAQGIQTLVARQGGNDSQDHPGGKDQE